MRNQAFNFEPGLVGAGLFQEHGQLEANLADKIVVLGATERLCIAGEPQLGVILLSVPSLQTSIAGYGHPICLQGP